MADYVDKGLKIIGITISKPVLALVCIIFGVLVIVLPDLLVWIVGLFLIIQGILMLTDIFEQERSVTTVAVSKGPFCSQCGTGNIKEAVYCKKCGKNLGQSKQNRSTGKAKSKRS